MNIKQAKEEIRNAMIAYFSKDEYGGYIIPIEKQRPIFLIGPPGIGKTAIMEQIASELGVGLVSYSMTHHTRQSALGLPFIVKKDYGGTQYEVSEYTMSEIIASVYDMIESTGYKEGILFLDEINCVSETLAPAMLQFLQYKIFGRHNVPDGWIVVTAGNPPEYNNSVREFDIVTLDRMKRINVEPDYDVWKEFAYVSGVHASIMTYLDIKQADFYNIETTIDGKEFVTARGWSDLSDMIKLYEKNDIPVKANLISQYIQHRRIAKSFAVYYDLYKKYQTDYKVNEILAGNTTEDVKENARAARFDERLTILGLLLDGILEEIKKVCVREDVLTDYLAVLKNIRTKTAKQDADMITVIDESIDLKRTEMRLGKEACSLSLESEYRMHNVIELLGEEKKKLREAKPENAAAAFKLVKKDYDRYVKELKVMAEEAGRKLSNVFIFCKDAFEGGQEMLILVTELTISNHAARFISRYGCKEYFENNKELMFYERQKEIVRSLQDLDLD